MKIGTWTLVGACIIVTACGGAQQPRAALPIVRTAPVVEDERRPYAEVTAHLPQAAAEEVDGLWVHLHSPSVSWSKLPTLVQGLPPLAPFKQLSQGGALLPRDAAAVIDLAQPLDMSMPIPTPGDSDFSQVWVFRVRSPEVIVRGEAGLTLHRVSEGVWDMGSLVPRDPLREPSSPPLDDDEEENPDESEGAQLPPPLHCRLLHLPEPVGFRVVCGQVLEQLTLQQPLLLASVGQHTSSDLHLELSGSSYRSVREKILERMKRKSARSGDAGERRGAELLTSVTEALFDHRRLSFDFALNGQRADAELSFVYGSQLKSPRFEKWLEYSSTHGSLSPSFARLWPNSGMTIGFNGLGQELVAFTLAEVATAMDECCVVAPKDMAEARAVMAELAPPEGRVTVAFGYDAESALAVLNAGVRAADEAEKTINAADAKALQAAMAGWLVIGIDVPPSRYLPAVKRLYASRNLPAPSRNPSAGERSRSHTRWKVLPVPRGLPVGTQHYLGESRKNAKDQGAPLLFAPELDYDEHVFVVPDVERTWIVLARSQDGALRRARDLLTQTNAPPSVSEPAHPAGAFFFDMASLVQAATDWDSSLQREMARHELGGVLRAPKRGKVSTPLWLDVAPNEDGGGGYRLRAKTQVNLDEWLAEMVAISAGTD